MNGHRIGVLIVDDSAVVRQVLSARLNSCTDIEVLGAAPDPVFAIEQMNRAWPDVVVLDIEMPRMDGLSFLRKIMAVRPTPVVICSTLTQHGRSTVMEALAAGAVSIVAKPTIGVKKFIEDDSGDIVSAVKAAAAGRVGRPIAASVPLRPLVATANRVVAIGTSTGGTQALEIVLTALPRTSPGIVVVQHMPEHFTAAFAERLDTMCKVEIKEAADGDRVHTGRVLVAPGGRHMELRRDGAQYRVRVLDGPPVNRHRPSVDVLFRSVAKAAGCHGIGIIMTGMGDDGARGLLDMRRVGGMTLAQDEASCVVHGMPKEAMRLGAVDHETPLSAIAGVICQHG